jgi:hypothetical protein
MMDDSMKNDEVKPVRIPGVEEVGLVIRNYNGVHTLFTTDGKLLANQGCGGHFFYVGDNPRFTTFRTAFLVDGVKVDSGPSVK